MRVAEKRNDNKGKERKRPKLPEGKKQASPERGRLNCSQKKRGLDCIERVQEKRQFKEEKGGLSLR